MFQLKLIHHQGDYNFNWHVICYMIYTTLMKVYANIWFFDASLHWRL